MNSNNNIQEEYNVKLYNSVFNNIYLKSIIFHHLNIFNLLLPVQYKFKSIQELQQFKYKEYLNTVRLDFDEYDLNQLPVNIRDIAIPKPPPTLESNINQIMNSIPNHIESLKFIKRSRQLQSSNNNSNNNSGSSSGSGEGNSSSNSSGTINSISKLKSLELDNLTLQYLNSIPSSITSLIINGHERIKLKNSQIQSNLKVLKYLPSSSFEDVCLPETLTDLVFSHTNNPLTLNQFSSNNLIKLDFGCNLEHIGSNIRFPNTLQHLKIICGSFNATLPNSLKSLKIDIYRYEYEIEFPSSLEHLYITYSNNLLNQEGVFKSRHSAPINLKSLEICSSIVDSNGHSILPDRLESLTLWDFNQVIKENQLPSSLTILKIGGMFQQVIDINVLPSSLEILEIYSDYSQVINPLAIPPQLKLLSIINTNNHPINLTPSSHPNTVIDCDDLNSYYDPSNTDIRVLKLPDTFNSPLSTLQLQDKCNLNYLHLGYQFNHPIQLSDLPINNQIKTLELSFRFDHTINLEYFQHLESIIINRKRSSDSNISTKITTTINDNGTYNYYNLKDIQIPNSNNQYINQLDINFYKFIKLNKSQH